MGIFKRFGSRFMVLLGAEDKGDPGDVMTRVGERGVAFQAPSGGGGGGETVDVVIGETTLQFTNGVLTGVIQ